MLIPPPCKGEDKFSSCTYHSIGARDCYVTVQESGKRLTEPAELPLIEQVIRVMTALPSAEMPAPFRGK
eukprot:3820559-Prymnesium_polylepis.1